MSALDDLQALLPPPPGYGRDFDWTAAQQRLGVTALPQDFTDLLAAYGDVRFCNLLRLYRPSAHPYLDLADVTLAAREPLGDDEFGELPTELPPGVSIDPATLIQWGGSFCGTYGLWDAHDPDSDNWTLVFTDIDRIQWGFYPGTVTEFVLDWLTGRTIPIPMWNLDNILRGAPVFCEFYDPLDPTDTALDRVEATTA
ncbi:hypothetical protein [Nocardia wallacei]|uniref:hypothetical protein n=1 Tax=Nocardia wallacei TaxID=480035 RepID=UPI00245658BB|nr:hypothetical protein [Nocardia wallacei]